MMEYNYTVFYEPAEEGGYTVHVPAIPEICTEGETLEEARLMAEDAIRLVIKSNLDSGEPVPKDVIIEKEPVKEKIAVKFAA